jgi:hypothetical protein
LREVRRSYCLLLVGRIKFSNKNEREARHQWLTPVTLATQEAELRKITIQTQPRQTVP